MELTPELLQRLDRVLQSAEQILPKPSASSVDWSVHFAANWTEQLLGGHLEAVDLNDSIGLDDLKAMDVQKGKVDLNTQQLVAGWPANNVLLWGARGTGKSSLVRALLNTYKQHGLRLIQVDKYQLQHLPKIVEQIKNEPYKFILFCDDLAFNDEEQQYKELKSALDGAIFSLPDHIVIYATSNRRHLVPEYHSDNDNTRMVDGQLHFADVVEEKISLSDRFGVWVSFYPTDQKQYLQIVNHWVVKLAAQWQLKDIWSEECQALSLRWALTRGTRSGRTAYQFARHWIGQMLLQQKE